MKGPQIVKYIRTTNYLRDQVGNEDCNTVVSYRSRSHLVEKARSVWLNYACRQELAPSSTLHIFFVPVLRIAQL